MKFSAPARIDLAGGTLDVPPLCFLVRRAATLNLAIDRRVTISYGSKPGFVTQEADNQDISHLPLYQEALSYLGFAHGDLGFEVVNEIPAASGLGGSSSLLSALVRLLKSRQTSKLDSKVLLEQVTVLEHRLLGKPAGTQDAIAAINGGLSWIEYQEGFPKRRSLELPGFLSDRPLILVYSSEQHHSGINNWAVVHKACEGDPATLRLLDQLADNAHEMKAAVTHNQSSRFFDAVKRESHLRSELCPTILNHDMAQFAAAMGDSVACKACGAGGGGAMWVYGPELDLSHIREVASTNNLQVWKIKPDTFGIKEV